MALEKDITNALGQTDKPNGEVPQRSFRTRKVSLKLSEDDSQKFVEDVVRG